MMTMKSFLDNNRQQQRQETCYQCLRVTQAFRNIKIYVFQLKVEYVHVAHEGCLGIFELPLNGLQLSIMLHSPGQQGY